MRKSLLAILLMLSFTFAVAQPRLSSPEVSFGVQGGAMASMVNFSPSVSQRPINSYLGATAGLIFRYARHKYCGLQVELNWMQKGWKEDDTGYQRRLDYVELPFLAHINFGKQWRGFINIGPQIGYCINSSYNNMPDLLSDELKSTAQYEDISRPFDWGVAAGAGFMARTITGTWQLEARFNYSLGSIFSNGITDYFTLSQPMNLSLSAAWLWEFKKADKKKTAKK